MNLQVIQPLINYFLDLSANFIWVSSSDPFLILLKDEILKRNVITYKFEHKEWKRITSNLMSTILIGIQRFTGR